MRLFFAGLLVLNIGFAGWYWFLQEPVTDTVQVPPVDRGVEMLKLATELQEEDGRLDHRAPPTHDRRLGGRLTAPLAKSDRHCCGCSCRLKSNC